ALGDAAVKNLAQYLLGLSGQAHDATAAAAGETVFKATCIACHGPDAKGNPMLGAPNLSDSVWLYGGTQQAIETSIRDGRQGHMPAWSTRLSDQEIHVLTGYVHHLSQRGKAGTP
ncbi:MAG TPA: c-type cytochrome, partial [Pseudomonadales bacterium]|nr:c-type cytochrome [Pseudomonadales bacterium]